MIIEKSELVRRINVLEKAIPARTDIDCMKGILVKDGRMCSNDYQIAISIHTEHAAGECFIIPQKAIAIIKNLPDGKVEISPNGSDSITIKAGRTKTKIGTYAADGFPDNFVLEGAETATMDYGKLCEMLSRTAYATSTNEARPIHTGVLLEAVDGTLNVVACDGFRMSWAQSEYTGNIKMVIPKFTVKLLLSIKSDDDVSIQSKGDKAVFTIGDYVIYSRLLSGDFVRYKSIFPVRDNPVQIDRIKLLNGLHRISLCADSSVKCKVEMTGCEKNLHIGTHNVAADYAEDLEVETPFAKELRINFNSAYLIDMLKSYDCPTVDCYFGGSADALTVDDGELKSLVLPVRMEAK